MHQRRHSDFPRTRLWLVLAVALCWVFAVPLFFKIALSQPYAEIAIAIFYIVGFVCGGIIAMRYSHPPLSNRFCRSCGYDLRATPHRCPECGRLAPHGRKVKEW